jgi:hypothetical protein
MKWAVIALVLGGCDSLLDLKHLRAPTGCHDETPSIVADTFLDATAPTTIAGSYDGVIASDGNPALFKFGFATPVGTDERIEALTLTLYALVAPYEAKVCSASHATCAHCTISFERWSLSWLKPTWIETAANVANATATVPWAQPSASDVPGDRSAMIVSGVSAIDQGMQVITADEAELDAIDQTPFLGATEIAFVLDVTGGTAAFTAREPEICYLNTIPPPATLTVSVCQ